MITEDYVSFNITKLLKEKGFDEPCLMCYNSDKKIDNYGLYRSCKNSEVFAMTAPTLQMAMKWLRKVHGLFIHIDVIRGVSCWLADIQDIKGDVAIYPIKDEFPNYEKACETAIKYCLENLI